MESEKPVIDFARVRTFTCMIGVGSPAGARRGCHWPDPAPFPADDGTASAPADDQHSWQWCAQNVRWRERGSATGEVRRPSAPGRRAGESPHPPVGRRWTIGRCRGRDGHVKRRAAVRSLVPWRTCQKADVQRDGGTRSPTRCWVWETTGLPSHAARRSADIAVGRHI